MRLSWTSDEYNKFPDDVKKWAIYRAYFNAERYSIYVQRESRYNKRYKLDREFLAYNK